MASVRMSYEEKRQAWLRARMNGIGGSEASAVLGLNPYKTNVQLWEEKTGRVIPEDIGYKPYVKYGKDAEKPLRDLFKLDFPKYKVTYSEFEMMHHPQYPFIFATLDGKLVDLETGERGVLEIKTTEVLSSMAREKWNDKIPDNYYIQVLHQLLATGWGFAILKAQLKYDFGKDGIKLITKHYMIRREEVLDDLGYLESELVKYWNDYVLTDKRPPLLLPAI